MKPKICLHQLYTLPGTKPPSGVLSLLLSIQNAFLVASPDPPRDFCVIKQLLCKTGSSGSSSHVKQISLGNARAASAYLFKTAKIITQKFLRNMRMKESTAEKKLQLKTQILR